MRADGNLPPLRKAGVDTNRGLTMTTSTARYAGSQIGLHWLIFLLFLFNVIVSDDMGRALRIKLEGGVPDQFAALLHPPVGLAILLLTLVRIVLRWRLGAPALPAGKPVLNRLAHLGHLALYGLLLAVPLSGMAAWGAGIRAAGDLHEILVGLTVAVVIGHAGAALFHHFVLKDGLLARMRPRRG